MKLSIEMGDYCTKYDDFVTRETVDKCEKAREKGFKGCYGSGCDMRTSLAKVNDGQLNIP